MAMSYSFDRPPRVFYMPDEGSFDPSAGQVGGRDAFGEMLRKGIIGDLEIYSFLAEYRARGRSVTSTLRALIEAIRAFQPDIVFWQHPSEYPVDVQLLREIRNCGSSPLIVYHEADPFDTFYKRIHSSVKILYRECDVFFTIGLGDARERFFKIKRHPHFYYIPHNFDFERVASRAPDPTKLGTKYDAVMIGTIAAAFKGMFPQPSSKQRVLLARGLVELFGDRFAAYGRGWPSGTNAAGPIPYASQAEIIQSSRMSVIWELYPDYTFYFSDRLPIALGAGVPFVTNGRTGYDVILRDCPGVFSGTTIPEILDIAVYLRGLPIEEIAAIGAATRVWALNNLESRVVFNRAFNICRQVWSSGLLRSK